MDIEDLEMNDITEEREEEETNLDWDVYGYSLENFDNNTSVYEGKEAL